MAALQCDICGGKLIGKPGGLFECDSCGMEYSTEWAKAKIQEIRGTVSVEGTVEVQGTVKVDGPVEIMGSITVRSLCDRGFFELEKQDAEAARSAFSRALDLDVNWGDIYMGLIMADFHPVGVRNPVCLCDEETFRKKLLNHELDNCPHFGKFLSTPGSEKKRLLTEAYQQMLEDEKRQIEENRIRGNRKMNYYRELRKKYNPVGGRITRHGDHILDQKGRMYALHDKDGADFEANVPWDDMVWISSIGGQGKMLLGVYADGTVIAESRSQRIEAFDPNDRIVQALGYNYYETHGFAGLREDGILLTSTQGTLGEVKDTLRRAAQKWKGHKIEALCELTLDLVDSEVLYAVAPSDPDRGHVAWKEQGPAEMAVELFTNGTVDVHYCDYPTVIHETKLWTDIIQAVPGKKAVAGLRADGTVVYSSGPDVFGNFNDRVWNEVSDWQNIVFIRMIGDEVVGVRRDGYLEYTGQSYKNSLIETENIRLFADIDTLASDIARQRRRAYTQWQEKMEQQRLALLAAEEEEEVFDPYAGLREELQQQIEAIHREMDGLKGIFTAKRRKELEEKMGWLLLELDSLPGGKEE